MRGALSALAAMSRSLENPATPLRAGSAIASASELWPGSAATGDPTRIGSALRCIGILSSGVAGCPLKITKRDKDRTEVHLPALEQRVGGGVTTPFELWETVVSHIATRGNAYVRKVRSRDGRVVALVPIHPDRVNVRVEDGSVAGLPWVKIFEIDGGRAVLTAHEIMHIPGLSMDGVTGISIIANLRRVFEIAENAEKVASDLFRNGLLQDTVITTADKLDEERSQILRARFRAKVGVDNAHDPLIMDNGAKVEKLTLTPADAQFLETRKYSKTDMATIFGLPGWLINDQEKSTSWGSGMEQQLRTFVTFSLQPYFQRIEQRIEREICDPATEQARFKFEGLLRGDSRSRAAFYGSAIQHGWMVPNEPRDLEDMPPVEWGDEPYRPYNESAASQSMDADPTTEKNDDGTDDV